MIKSTRIQMARHSIDKGEIFIDIWYPNRTHERVKYDVPLMIYLEVSTNPKYLQNYNTRLSEFADMDGNRLYEIEFTGFYNWQKAIRWLQTAKIPIIYATNYVWEYMRKHKLICNDYLKKNLSLDIEVDPNGMDLKNLSYEQPIVAIALEGNDGRKFCFDVPVSPELSVNPDDERKLLKKVYAVCLGYWCLMGWNIKLFDMIYIKERTTRLGLNLDWDQFVRFDLMDKYEEFLKRDRKPGEITNKKLDSAGLRMLGEGKEGFNIHKMMEFLRDDPELVRKYVKRDAEMVNRLYGIKGIGSLCEVDVNLSQHLYTFPTKMYPTYLFELYLDIKARGRKIKLPNKWEHYQEKVAKKGIGGLVLEPVRGLHKNVMAMDFKCLKPDAKVFIKDKGEIDIKDVLVGDHVFGIKGWQEVLKNSSYDYDGIMVNINGLSTTPNHKTPVMGNGTLYDIKGIDFVRKNNIKRNIVQLPKDYVSIYDTDDEKWLYSELVGILIAEGSFTRIDAPYYDSKRKKKRISKQYRVEINISREEEDFKNRVFYIFNKLFDYKPGLYYKKDGLGMTIKSSRKAIFKKIKEYYDSDDLIPEAVLRGYMEGDGGINRPRKSIQFNGSFANRTKLRRIFNCLDQVGIKYRKHEYAHLESHPGGLIHCEISGYANIVKYQINVGFISDRKTNLLYDALHKRTTRYKSEFLEEHERAISCDWHSGKVYDLTLDGDPYYFANGVLTHNSLYPNIMRTHNIGINNGVFSRKKADNIINTMGMGFKKDVKGLTAEVMDELIMTRYKYRDKLDDPNLTDAEEKWYGVVSDSYKTLLVSANGIFDNKYFKYRNQPMYNATTKTGQWYLNASRKILEKMGYKVLYGDSVMPNTPVVIKRDGLVEVVPIEDLHWSKSNSNAVRKLKKDVEIWTDKGWSKIIYSFRHKVKKIGYRILTTKGYVETTSDHSLVVNGKEISPKDLKVGDKIERYRPVIDGDIKVDPELAWTLGFYAAEGTRGTYDYKKYQWRIANQDTKLLVRASRALKGIGLKTKIIYAKDNMKYLVPNGSAKDLMIYFGICHSRINDEKIVPWNILNGDDLSKESFFDGYMAGDGHVSRIGIWSFVSIDYSLLEGLTFILDSFGKDYYLDRRKDKKNVVRVRIRNTKARKRVPLEIISIEEFDINGPVYDIETENHHFCGGLGGILLHNTDSIFFEAPYGGDHKRNVASIPFLEDELNRRIKNAAVRKFNLDPNKYYIDFRAEKIYSKIFFSEKKNYVGRYIWKEYKWIDPMSEKAVDAKGIVMMKYNTIPIVKETMMEIFKILLSKIDDEKELKRQFIRYLQKLRADLYAHQRDELLMISQRVDKMTGYKSEPPHIKAAKKLDKLGLFEPGMNVEYIRDESGEIFLYGVEDFTVSRRTYDRTWRMQVGRWVNKILGIDISSHSSLDFGYSKPAQSLI